MYPDPNRMTDAERSSEAFVSLRNDERMRHLSLHFHEIYGGGGSSGLSAGEQTGPVTVASTLQPPPTAAHSPCVDSGGGRDPFDSVPKQPIPIYRDGQDYEETEMRDGLVAEAG